MTSHAFNRIRSFLPLTLALSAIAVAVPALSQVARPNAQGPATKAPAFDVVSIRQHVDDGNGSHWWTPTADGYKTYSAWPFELIFLAYELQYPGQLIGLPEWCHEDTYDIEARIDGQELPAYQKLSDRERRSYVAPMLRAMLADRFSLKAHHETRLLPVYELMVAKGGAKLKQSADPEDVYGMVTDRGLIRIHAGPIGARFIVGLSDATGRIVIDKTGLTGYYDIDLKWTPEEDQANGESGPSLFTAIEEQLGLKLVPSKAPVDVVVVDHIERPSEN